MYDEFIAPSYENVAEQLGSPPAAPGTLQVAVGLIVNTAGQVLIARRQLHQEHGGLLEFPGGKMKDGESAVEALIRELKEELDIEVSADDVLPSPFTVVSHLYGSRSVELDVRCVLDFRGVPRGREGQEVFWMNIEDLDAECFPEANVPIIDKLTNRQSAD